MNKVNFTAYGPIGFIFFFAIMHQAAIYLGYWALVIVGLLLIILVYLLLNVLILKGSLYVKHKNIFDAGVIVFSLITPAAIMASLIQLFMR
jgi:hypothetical protein